MFLTQSHWEWLFKFVNRKRIFPIDTSLKFAALIVDRMTARSPLRAAFMVAELSDWERTEPPTYFLDRTTVPLLSPISKAIPEIRSNRELDVNRLIYSNASPLLGEETHQACVVYGREYHASDDARNFTKVADLIALGYTHDRFGRMMSEGRESAVPLYQGLMIDSFTPSNQGYVDGQGQTSRWEVETPQSQRVRAQYYLMASFVAESAKSKRGLKLVAPKVSKAINARTMRTCLLVDWPTVDSLNTCQLDAEPLELLVLSAAMNSLSYDFAMRSRLSGLNMSRFIVCETPFPKHCIGPSRDRLMLNTARLSLVLPVFAPHWLRLTSIIPILVDVPWKCLWAVTEADRLRLRVEIDALCRPLRP